MSKIIGIDLGTTNSCVAVMEGGKPVVIANTEGFRTTPSIVAFSKTGERLVGDAAKRQAVTNVDKTITSIKRHMGTDYRVNIDGKKYSPQEISAMILQKLKKDAESYLGETITEAVITVPAYFSDAQRQATKDAGRIAGLKVERIINEPTAAALAYGLDNDVTQKIMVYDLGGGTFDVSVIEIGNGVIEVLATSGDNHLGGDDFDERITQYIISEFKRQERIDLSNDKMALQRVSEEAEKAKKELSSSTSVQINIPFITTTKEGGKHLDMTLTRAKFDELTYDLVERTAIPVQDAMRDAGIPNTQLGRVLLVGGSTRIVSVQNKVKQLTGKEPSKNLNPDECVALGASVQGGKLGGELGASSANDILLLDVTPLSLSIETVGGVATRLIERNSTIPTRYSQVFSTAANFQTSVDIKVLQGERKFARDNKLIGNFKLKGIKRAPRGVPQIEVTFDIDVNGILSVSAKDLGTGKEQHITITASSNLPDDEIERAVREAQEYASADKQKQEAMDIRNEAEALIYQTEQILSKSRKQMDKSKKSQIKSELSSLKKLVNKTKPESITDSEAENIRENKERLASLIEEYAGEDFSSEDDDNNGDMDPESGTYESAEDDDDRG